MSAATVTEPFLLSSYPESAVHVKRKVAPLFASLPSGSDVDPYVTVAVQGDGIHILDTSSLHSAVSHTLGPTISFSCPPASRVSHPRGGVRTCTTYAVLESGPDVQPEGKGRTITAWQENLAGVMSSGPGAEYEKKKKTAIASHPVAHVYAPDYLQEHLLLVGTAGEISIANEELHVLGTYTPQHHQPTTLRKHFVFHATSCTFVPPHAVALYSAVSVSFLRSGDVLRLSVIGLGGGNVTLLGECVVPIEEIDIIDISCSASGFISVLLPSGIWLALSLSTSPSSLLSISSVGEPLRLQGLTFINSTRTSEASLAALTSSHVLLSAVTSGSPLEILLLIWDLRYGVLLAQQIITMPSTLPRPKKHGAVLQLDVSALPSSGSSASKLRTVQLSAILSLLPHPEREPLPDPSSSPARSTILVVPLTVSAKSTIAAAMGNANAGARWISTKVGPHTQSQNVRGLPELSIAARKTMREIKAAVEGSANGSTAAAENAFFEHVKQQSKDKGAAGDDQNVYLEYPFVQGILQLVLRAPAGAQGSSAPGKGQNGGAYSPKIVRYLLENRAVSSSMVEDGLLLALASCNDWDTVTLAMRTVPDLPEKDTIALLSQVVAAHRRSSAAATVDENAMQVDSVPSASTPALPAFLAQCVTYPSTPALQRTALRKHLPDAADTTLLLEVLDGWIARHTEDDALLLTAASEPDGHIDTRTRTRTTDLPRLDEVLAFLQTLLDASFIALLAHAPAHRLLHALSAHIELALARTGELELLYGPLEPFARAAAAKAKVQAETKEGARPDSGKDWRRKKKLVHEHAGMAIGLYQVEELVL